MSNNWSSKRVLVTGGASFIGSHLVDFLLSRGAASVRVVDDFSSGMHSNGYTLARRALLERGGLELEQHVSELGCSLAEELLRPTLIYVKPVMALANISE